MSTTSYDSLSEAPSINQTIDTVLDLEEVYFSVIVLHNGSYDHWPLVKKVKNAGLPSLQAVSIEDRRLEQWLVQNKMRVKIRELPCCLLAADGKKTKVVSLDKLDHLIERLRLITIH